eukprot:GEMP01074743.1.p1 GENE.GEMP01074743.1~~GEMP01074743.1.p1  ORF type:complete len:269 (+),score=93.26 GEMP01074743.1:25-807(+)
MGYRDMFIKLALDQLPQLPPIPKVDLAENAGHSGGSCEGDRADDAGGSEKVAFRLYTSLRQRHAEELFPSQNDKSAPDRQVDFALKWQHTSAHTRNVFRRLASFQTTNKRQQVSHLEMEKKEQVKKWREVTDKEKERAEAEEREARQKDEARERAAIRKKRSARRKQLRAKLEVWRVEREVKDAEQKDRDAQEEETEKLDDAARRVRTLKMKQKLRDWHASQPFAPVKPPREKDPPLNLRRGFGVSRAPEWRECALSTNY